MIAHVFVEFPWDWTGSFLRVCVDGLAGAVCSIQWVPFR